MEEIISDTNKAVEFKSVSFFYGKNQILDSVDFSIDYNKISLLSGVSGSGKSTIMFLINGAIPNIIYGKLQGEIICAGKSILKNKVNKL